MVDRAARFAFLAASPNPAKASWVTAGVPLRTPGATKHAARLAFVGPQKGTGEQH